MNHMSGHKKILAFLTAISISLYLLLSFLVHKDVFRSFDYDSMIGVQKTVSSCFDIPFASTDNLKPLCIFISHAQQFLCKNKFFLSFGSYGQEYVYYTY